MGTNKGKWTFTKDAKLAEAITKDDNHWVVADVVNDGSRFGSRLRLEHSEVRSRPPKNTTVRS